MKKGGILYYHFLKVGIGNKVKDKEMMKILRENIRVFLLSIVWAQLFGAQGEPEGFMPSTLFKLNSFFSHHVIVVEKYGHRLLVYENKGPWPVLLRSYSVATGKYSGNKKIQGDKKTPEGIYFITDFHSSRELIETYGKKGEIYGAGAFVLNYPNPFDVLEKKTGHGIWLHSTNDNHRVSVGMDSRGCVVSIDKDLIDISRFVELSKTPLIITQNHHFLSRKSWMKKRKGFEDFLDHWSQAWRNEDFAQYISHYHQQKYWDSFRKNYTQFKNYKKAVFSTPGLPELNISHVSIIGQKDQIIIQFVQNYRSTTISDIGKKTLYLKQNSSYQWKIIHETWSRLEDPTDPIDFTPSQRFFSQRAKN